MFSTDDECYGQIMKAAMMMIAITDFECYGQIMSAIGHMTCAMDR